MTEFRRGQARCYLVYALAPDGMAARAANDALNEYIADRRRGLPVFHDHFTQRPHGGVAVLYISSADELALLGEPGPLEGWTITTHPLVFALAPLGFLAQTEFTTEQYGGTTFDGLRTAEEDDPRYWWREHNQ
ncbi:MAG: hypothetical protein ABR583_03365 [Gaiellaceae bacterium]